MAQSTGLFAVEPLAISVRLPADTDEAVSLASAVRVAVDKIPGIRFIEDEDTLRIIVPVWANARALHRLVEVEVVSYFAEKRG